MSFSYLQIHDVTMSTSPNLGFMLVYENIKCFNSFQNVFVQVLHGILQTFSYLPIPVAIEDEISPLHGKESFREATIAKKLEKSFSYFLKLIHYAIKILLCM